MSLIMAAARAVLSRTSALPGRRIVLALVTLVLALTGVGLTGGVAAAAPCVGTGCNNRDPSSVGCDTLHVSTLGAVVNNSVGTSVELRWSASCKAFWVRIRREGENMTTNGCGMAAMDNHWKGRVATQRYVATTGKWYPYRTYEANWKDCGDSWDGDTSTGWSVMAESDNNADERIRAHVCEWYDDLGENGKCSAWYTKVD